MNVQRQYLSMLDVNRLREVVERARANQMAEPEAIAALDDKLARAQVCNPAQVPDDVVTMNSLAQVRNMRTGRVDGMKLVYPNEADAAAGKISVVTLLGVALLGSRVCDLLEVPSTTGPVTYQVEELTYRPERDKAYHL